MKPVDLGLGGDNVVVKSKSSLIADRLEDQLGYYGPELAGSLKDDIKEAIVELRKQTRPSIKVLDWNK